MKIDTVMTINRKKDYLRPEADPLTVEQEEMICTSPDEGGLEDTEDEDWTL